MRCVAALLLLAACGEPPVETTGGAAGGGEGGQGAGGAPATPFAPSWTCPPGALELDDGSCQAAGIEPEACGRYFVSDGARGCTPILPEAECAPGTMAIPGERACRSIAACGAGLWGDIPVEPGTVYVDDDAAAGGDGSVGAPFASLEDAVDAAATGTLVAIAAGTYAPVVVAGKALRLWGTCPDEVLVASNTNVDAVVLGPDADGAEVHGLAAQSPTRAVAVDASTDVLLEAVWLRDSDIGLDVGNGSSGTLRGALVESNDGVGVATRGSAFTIDATVIRDGGRELDNGGAVRAFYGLLEEALSPLTITRSYFYDHGGVAIEADGIDLTLRDVAIRQVHTTGDASDEGAVVSWPQTFAELPGHVDAERVVIEQGGASGFTFIDSSGRLEAVTVRDNDPTAGTGYGDGVFAYQIGILAERPPELVVRASTFKFLRGSGATIQGMAARFEGVYVRHVLPYHVTSLEGRGIAAEVDLVVLEPADVTVRGCHIEEVVDAGIYAGGSRLDVQGTVVRDVEPRPADSTSGRGITFEVDVDTRFTPSGRVADSLVEECHELGIGVFSGELEVVNSAIHGVRDNEGVHAACLFAEPLKGFWAPASLTAHGVEMHDCDGFGLLIVGATVVASEIAIADIVASHGAFGDGITVASGLSADPRLATSLELTSAHVTRAARAGLAAFGGHVVLEDVSLSCNPVDLDGETLANEAAVIDDGDGNVCGCGDDQHDCVVLSTGLDAPLP
jgi:hypothetical protein